MTRTVDTDLQAIVDMLRDFTGLQVEHKLFPNHVSGPIVYTITFRTPLADPGGNHATVGSTRLHVNLTQHKLYRPFQSRPQAAHPDLLILVDQVINVYYDNLEE